MRIASACEYQISTSLLPIEFHQSSRRAITPTSMTTAQICHRGDPLVSHPSVALPAADGVVAPNRVRSGSRDGAAAMGTLHHIVDSTPGAAHGPGALGPMPPPLNHASGHRDHCQLRG